MLCRKKSRENLRLPAIKKPKLQDFDYKWDIDIANIYIWFFIRQVID